MLANTGSNLPVEQQLDFEDDAMEPTEGRKRTGAGGKFRQATRNLSTTLRHWR